MFGGMGKLTEKKQDVMERAKVRKQVIQISIVITARQA